jgi:hypothetical protein
MRRQRFAVPVLGAAAVLLVALSAASAFATTTTFNAAAAPNGTHVQRGTPSCSVNGLTVSCGSYQVAGVGNTNAMADLNVTYSATVVCSNGGGNPSDSQHQGSFTKGTSTGQLSPKNGRLTVPPLSSTPPTEQEFLAQQTCPNPNWTPTIPGGISVSSFTYTLDFVGFTGDYITITGP